MRDGEIAPACVQSCPAQALLFGDLDDPDSRIARAYRRPGLETLLEELGTRPRVRYAPRPTSIAAALREDAEADA